ncbi:MAG: endolytic transglycosylase MltG [bacterium]|nr:endolytic transglycosylase MltG [bacterium]
MTKNKKIIILGGVVLAIICIAIFIFLYQFSAPQRNAEQERIVVNPTTTTTELIPKLKEQGYIRNEKAFEFALRRRGGEIEPGGYKISKSMSAWKIAKILTSEPYMKWVVIPEGLRKEQIAEILATELGWSEQEKSDWITKFTAMKYDYIEGVYFPDTYLIPIDETGLEIAERFIDKFNEEFAPYAEKFAAQNIKWTTALKIASLIQREAGSKDDMPLIAGIIWNRLLKGMKLEIDATLQYARGNAGDGWWAPINVADKKIDSPYNTYLYSGLPPHPICNPGINAIDAVLNSTKTECIYYLHDSNKQIHCAKTYAEHKTNIEKYLK